MRWRRIGTGAAFAGWLVLFPVAAHAGEPSGTPSVDIRQRVTLSPAQRNEILVEMRQMLGSIRGILYGLAANDMRTVASAAQESGTERSPDPEYKRKVPEGFRQFEIQTHKGFDVLAEKAKAGGGREDIIKEVATLTNNCVGCHNAYRVDESR